MAKQIELYEVLLIATKIDGKGINQLNTLSYGKDIQMRMELGNLMSI